MTNPRQLLDFHKIPPKKSLGQNFIHDPNTLQKIVEVAHIQPGHTVLEVGPGTGALTRLLAQQAEHVLSVEVDERLIPILRLELAPYPNVELHWMDILNADIPALVGGAPYQVVANLPYYITSAILRKVLETEPKPHSITVTVQKEVADRMVAQPPDMSLLTVSIQFYGKPKTAMKVSPGVFYPRPDVDSAVVHMELYPHPIYDVPDEQSFFEVVRAGFSQKRKQIKNSLAAGLNRSNEQISTMLDKAGIVGARRAETLTLEEWAALTRAYRAES